MVSAILAAVKLPDVMLHIFKSNKCYYSFYTVSKFYFF